MKNPSGTKQELIKEISVLKNRIKELEQSESERKRTEEALKFTRFSLDNAADAMVCVGHDGRYIDVNDTFCRTVGYSREELFLMNVHDIDPNYPTEIWPEFWEKLKQSGSLTFESCHRTRGGKVLPVEITADFFEYNGKEYHCAFARDITERKRVEEALRESEEKFRILFEDSRDALMTTSPPEWRFTSCNQATLELFGAKDVAELTALSLADVSPELQPDGRPSADKALEMLETAMREGHHFFEWTHRRLKGEAFPCTVLLSRAEIGGKTFVQASVRNITVQKKIEEKLQENERKIRAILDQTFQFIGLMTTEGILIEVNKSALDAVGIEANNVLGKPFWETPWWTHSPELQEKIRQAVKNVVRGELVRFEATYLVKDGTLHYMDFSLKPIKDEFGNVIFMIPEGRDITERKQMEEKLEHFAIHDQLTGLLNRRSIEDILSRTIAKAKRGAVSSILYMDLDNFKDVNDSVGHSGGDEVLITLAGLFKDSVRIEDIIFRMGGDEFAVLLDGMATESLSSRRNVFVLL